MYSTTILSTTTLNLGNAWHCLKLNSHGSHYETTLPKNHHPKKASRRVKAERRGLGFLALNRKILCNCYINFKRHFLNKGRREIFLSSWQWSTTVYSWDAYLLSWVTTQPPIFYVQDEVQDKMITWMHHINFSFYSHRILSIRFQTIQADWTWI